MISHPESLVTHGILATNATPLVQVAVSRVIEKANALAPTVGSNLQQAFRAAEVRAIRRLLRAEHRVLHDELHI